MARQSGLSLLLRSPQHTVAAQQRARCAAPRTCAGCDRFITCSIRPPRHTAIAVTFFDDLHSDSEHEPEVEVEVEVEVGAEAVPPPIGVPQQAVPPPIGVRLAAVPASPAETLLQKVWAASKWCSKSIRPLAQECNQGRQRAHGDRTC